MSGSGISWAICKSAPLCRQITMPALHHSVFYRPDALPGMVVCLERGADLHMVLLMPLPFTVSCFSNIQIGFTFLVPAHPGSPGQTAVKRVRVCVYVLNIWWRCGALEEGLCNGRAVRLSVPSSSNGGRRDCFWAACCRSVAAGALRARWYSRRRSAANAGSVLLRTNEGGSTQTCYRKDATYYATFV